MSLLTIVGIDPEGDRPEPGVEQALERRWYGRGRETAGPPFPKHKNVERVLTLDSRWAGQIRYNRFAHRPELRGVEVTDAGETEMQLWLDEVYQLDVPIQKVSALVNAIAARESYHPVEEYLSGLVWDGEPRVEGLLHRYFSAADHPLYQRISLCWLVSSVARVLDPGCKVETVVILAGKQGAGKSTALKAMMPQPRWFSDSPLDLSQKDALLKLHSGVWWYELAELADVSRKEVEQVKSFVSIQEDMLRTPYGRRPVTWQRQTVFAGTTNAPRFLKDPTGNRRWWPVEIGRIHLDAIVRDRDQLWAEALHHYRAGVPWHLSPGDSATLEVLSEDFQEEDSWEPAIREWLEPRRGRRFSIRELFAGPLLLEVAKQNRAYENRVALLLKKIGVHRAGRASLADGRSQLWVLPVEERHEET